MGSERLRREAARTERDHPWPYDEFAEIRKRYKRWAPIKDMLRKDLAYIEDFQNRIFGRLIKDVRRFERHHKLVIV